MHFVVRWQLSNKMDVATNASKIFELLIQYLCVEHIDYAIELGLQGECHVFNEKPQLEVHNAHCVSRNALSPIWPIMCLVGR